MKKHIPEQEKSVFTGAVITLLLLALPIVVWLDLSALDDAALRQQADI